MRKRCRVRLATAGATVVSTVGSQSAANIVSGASAANAATSANTPDTLVKRDASGNFSAGSVTLNNNLYLPGPTATVYSGASSLLHSDGNDDFFAGPSAGFLGTSGRDNTASGFFALANNMSGSDNTANGANSLYSNTSGSNNIALGLRAGYNITTGSRNIDIGNEGLSTDTNIIRIGSGQTQAFIAGVNTGNGARLTNLNGVNIANGSISAAQIVPGAVVTNNATGITLNGTFNGNGTGLTNVSGTFTWQNVSGTTQQPQPNTGYLLNNPEQVTHFNQFRRHLDVDQRTERILAGGRLFC